MRRNPVGVALADLDAVLRGVGFIPRAPGSGSSHRSYKHPDLRDVLTIPAHGSTVKEAYVRQSLAAVDVVRRIRAEREAEAKKERGN